MKESLERISAAVIMRVLTEHRGESRRYIDLALDRAYPFGRRTGVPFRVWQDQLARQFVSIEPVTGRLAGILSIRVRMLV